jgi:ribosome-binding ATPase YchF (GTP1/OBG family)
LFTALTNQAGLAANYPFATIEPNVGIVAVPDARLQALANIVSPQRIVPAMLEFVDIAGLVKGASQGEGLGNQFLANIRETDAIVEVVRHFANQDVAHVEKGVDPARDIDIIDTELILADLGTLERALPRLEKAARRDRELAPNLDIALRLQDWLNAGNRAGAYAFASAEERALIADLHLLTAKPILYVANVDEDELDAGGRMAGADGAPTLVAQRDGSFVSSQTQGHAAQTTQRNRPSVSVSPSALEPLALSAKLEADIAELAADSPDEAAELLSSMGITESGLARLAHAAYSLLGLQSFFTAGPKEVRAWTIPVGAKAPQAAGVIHSDFEKGFIKAETASFADYIEYGGESSLRTAGKLRQEGKDYVVQDGDVVHFKFSPR